MKRNIILIVLLALLSWGVWSVMKPEVSENPNTPGISGSKTYTDPEGSFSFTYPAAFSVSGREASSTTPTGWSVESQLPGIILAQARVGRSYMPQTNFSEAWLTIGWSNDAEAIKTCHAVTNDPMPNGPVITQTQVSGHPFTKMISTDAGLGNFYETTSYKGLLDGDCYVIEYTIHSTNIQNYSPDQGITEFNKQKIVNELEGIVKSFTFLVNSD